MKGWLRSASSQPLNIVIKVPDNNDIQFDFIWIVNDGTRNREEPYLTWWRNQSAERHTNYKIVAISGSNQLTDRVDADELALTLGRRPEEFHLSSHDLCRFRHEVKQTSPCRYHVMILTDFYVADTRCNCKPRCVFLG